MPKTFTARGTDANGTGTPAALNGLMFDTVCGVARLSKSLHKAIEEHRKNPKHFLPTGYIDSYGSDIKEVFDALCAMQYERSTIELYTHVNGEFMKWLERRGEEGRATGKELYQFASDYVENSRGAARDRLGKYSDPKGLTLRHIIFYALRAVLDICFNMNVTSNMPRPKRPRPQPPAPQEVSAKLYNGVQNDRERLLLILINGLNLMPKDAAALRWDDFNESFEWLEFTVVKSGKKRLIIRQIVTGYQHALRGCLERAGGNRDAYIFPSTSSRGGEHLCVRTLQYTLGSMLKRSDITRRVTLTTLRLGGAYMPTNWNTPSQVDEHPDLPPEAHSLSSDALPTVPARPPVSLPDDETEPEPVPAAVPSEDTLASTVDNPAAVVSSPEIDATPSDLEGLGNAAPGGPEPSGHPQSPCPD